MSLVTVDDAEQFEFSSGQETAVVATPLPPVEVRWDRPGRVIEGTYTGSTLEKASWGNQLLYNVTGTKRAYRLPGTAHLHDLMSKVISGSRVRVTFEREREFAGGRSKNTSKSRSTMARETFVQHDILKAWALTRASGSLESTRAWAGSPAAGQRARQTQGRDLFGSTQKVLATSWA